MTNRKLLELQCDRIEMVLASHKAPARVTGGVVTPRAVQFHLAPAVETEINKVQALTDELALALGATNVRVSRQGSSLQLEVPRNDAQPVQLLPLMGKLADFGFPPFTAVLGMCDDGAPLLVRLPADSVGHILLSGPTGCGKTSLLRTIAASLKMTNPQPDWRLVYITQAQIGDLYPLIDHSITDPHVVAVIDDLTDTGPLTNLLSDGHRSGVYIVASGNVPSAGFSTLITARDSQPGYFDYRELSFMAAYIAPSEFQQLIEQS